MIKQAFAGLPDLNQCETLVDYGNVYHDHEELIDTQKNLQHLQRSQLLIIDKRFY